MKDTGNRLKAVTGMAMSALSRVFAPGDGEKCEKHGVRLRMMKRDSYRWHKEFLCPACHRRTIIMRAYPFKIYFSACGLIWSAVILALGGATIYGVVPGVQTLVRWSAESDTELAATLDGMPQEWASLYRMLKEVDSGSRGEAFMEYVTGSRKLGSSERSPVRLSLPALAPEGAGLFMGLFDSWDSDNVLPVMAELGIARPQDTP